MAIELSQNPFAILSLIAAPAVLTNAASVLALSTSNRFLRASERMRALATRVDAESKSPEIAQLLVRQVDRVERQATHLLVGLRAAYFALGSFAGASIISILGAVCATWRIAIAFEIFGGIALVAGICGAGSMVWACYNLLRATRLAMLNISEEAQLFRRRQGIHIGPSS
jgi:hypothetical protein